MCTENRGCDRNGHRSYVCQRCGETVSICSHCDRGNIYCGPACATVVRDKGKLTAALAYQQKPEGKRNHAARQAAYVARQKKEEHQKMTRQGRMPPPTPTIMKKTGWKLITRAVEAAINGGEAICCCCGRHCKGPGRRGYLGQPDRGPFERPGRSEPWWLRPS